MSNAKITSITSALGATYDLSKKEDLRKCLGKICLEGFKYAIDSRESAQCYQQAEGVCKLAGFDDLEQALEYLDGEES